MTAKKDADISSEECLRLAIEDLCSEYPTVAVEMLAYLAAALEETMELCCAAVANARVSYKDASACVEAIRLAFTKEQKP